MRLLINDTVYEIILYINQNKKLDYQIKTKSKEEFDKELEKELHEEPERISWSGFRGSEYRKKYNKYSRKNMLAKNII
jgi:predicted house-cleaning noncanonical NTP pyrophosphatase (MazG superfamily)